LNDLASSLSADRFEAMGFAPARASASAPRTHTRIQVKVAPKSTASTAKALMPITRPRPDTENEEITVIKLPTYVPVIGRPQESFAALQEWEGVVTEVRKDVFIASLIDLTNERSTFEEVAEIPREELSDVQNQALTKGMIFRWAIGFTRKDSGRQTRTSSIYFRRASAPKVDKRRFRAMKFEEQASVFPSS
jgi:hypothetical protein